MHSNLFNLFVLVLFFTFIALYSYRHLTNGFILTYQLGICCIYVVFVASNLKSLFDYFTGSVTDIRMYMLIILLPLILINWVNYRQYECNASYALSAQSQLFRLHQLDVTLFYFDLFFIFRFEISNTLHHSQR